MIEAMIDEGRAGSGYGAFRFLALPSPNDHIHLGNKGGSIDILRVVLIEHHPVQLPQSISARPDPTVTIRVENIASYGADPDDDLFPVWRKP